MSRTKEIQSLHSVQQAERAILAAVGPDRDMEELRLLAESAGIEVVGEFIQRRAEPNPNSYLGQGKAQELLVEIENRGATMVITDDDLTPIQQKNLEEAVGVEVLDRTQLILRIFAERAHTREGKLQVELAQLTYTLPRLIGHGQELSRLGGGLGMRGGPGETKLEADRRRIRKRIDELEAELEEVRRHREQARKSRRRLPFPTAALVGYTSAGKSTLLNALSGSEVTTDEKLFATLDPTTRRVLLPHGWGILITDTVGFIQRLPHHLVAAFRATLEEVTEADILIHVVDASHPRRKEQMEAVADVLEELGAANKPIVTALNKCDKLTNTYDLRYEVATRPDTVYISALKREGLQELLLTVENVVQKLLVPVRAAIPYHMSHLLPICHESGRVERVEYGRETILIEGRFTRDVANRLRDYQV
ncbi:MAG: GTPase HflX [Armatimonadota bacterium]